MLIAEEITGRFFNIISLFNSVIPIIVIQMFCYKKENGDVGLVFNKVLDLSDNNDDSNVIITNKEYWENKSAKNKIKLMDEIIDELKRIYNNLELKYNKIYIGLTQDGITRN